MNTPVEPERPRRRHDQQHAQDGDHAGQLHKQLVAPAIGQPPQERHADGLADEGGHGEIGGKGIVHLEALAGIDDVKGRRHIAQGEQ
jgi:hypothetical protein